MSHTAYTLAENHPGNTAGTVGGIVTHKGVNVAASKSIISVGSPRFHWPLLVAVVFALIVVALIVATSVWRRSPCTGGGAEEVSTSTLRLPCEYGWIFYLNVCYFFSVNDGSWEKGQEFCAQHNSSLAVITTQEEMDFVMRYKGIDDHWIGLKREKDGEWTWPNGTAFNNWFDVQGDSNCAYLNHDGAKNARCYGDRKWVCTLREDSVKSGGTLLPGGSSENAKQGI
ncbi:C-type lectin domain family 2 member B-like isoform X2 [Ambystoma mexicanum]|uniref:C-type lectin domain family 2 member B-like isoform X2 n=1 Tax=Ambystoma mexicanum TaxID=8296 RepID=UPI0037E75A0E